MVWRPRRYLAVGDEKIPPQFDEEERQPIMTAIGNKRIAIHGLSYRACARWNHYLLVDNCRIDRVKITIPYRRRNVKVLQYYGTWQYTTGCICSTSPYKTMLNVIQYSSNTSSSKGRRWRREFNQLQCRMYGSPINGRLHADGGKDVLYGDSYREANQEVSKRPKWKWSIYKAHGVG